MARRGLLAHLLHQAKVEARNRERAQRAAVRAHSAAVQLAERAARAASRAQAELVRATAADRKRLEREARDAHVAAMEADAEEQNLRLQETHAAIDSILAATLEVDDFVDLETLRSQKSCNVIQLSTRIMNFHEDRIDTASYTGACERFDVFGLASRCMAQSSRKLE